MYLILRIDIASFFFICIINEVISFEV